MELTLIIAILLLVQIQSCRFGEFPNQNSPRRGQIWLYFIFVINALTEKAPYHPIIFFPENSRYTCKDLLQRDWGKSDIEGGSKGYRWGSRV